MLKKRSSLIAVSTITFGATFLASSSLVNAESESNSNVNVTLDPIIVVSSPSSVNLTNDESGCIPGNSGSDATTCYGEVEINIATNNETGYTLTMTANSNGTGLINTADNSYTVPTLTEPSEDESLPINHWGFMGDSRLDPTVFSCIDKFCPIPALGDTTYSTINKTSSAGEISVTHISFGARITKDIPAGTYIGTITFSAVPNAPAPIE